MKTLTDRLGAFVHAGQAAQLAVDRAIERAELVRLCRDRGTTVRELAAVAPEARSVEWRDRYYDALMLHDAACSALDQFDHQPKEGGR